MAEFTALKTPGDISQDQLSSQLRTNLCAFLDWGLLGLNAFNSVHLNTVGPYISGVPSKLRLSDDSRYAKGSAWDSFRSNWVWESATDASVQPIQISGIYINTVFYPLSTTGDFSYNISYTWGRVIFNKPINVSSTVQVEYSYKLYNIYPDTVQWFKQLTKGTFRSDDSQFNQYGSGIWTTYPETRAQLPAIVVEPVPRREWLGYQLGGSQWLFTDVVFHVFSETAHDRDAVIDILTYQNEKKFFFFDKTMLARSGLYPLNGKGYLVNPSSIYPALVNNFLWRYSIVTDTTSQSLMNNQASVYNGSARWTLQIDFPEL